MIDDESVADDNESAHAEKNSSIHKETEEVNVLVETSDDENRQDKNVDDENDESSREEDSDTVDSSSESSSESQSEQKIARPRDETDQMYDFLLESLSDSELSGGTTGLYESYLKQNKNEKSKSCSSSCSSDSTATKKKEEKTKPEVPKKTVPRSTVEAVKKRLERIQLKKKGTPIPEDDGTVKSIDPPPPVYGNTAKAIEENELTCFDDMCVLLNPVELLNRWESPCVAAEQLFDVDTTKRSTRRRRRRTPPKGAKDKNRRNAKTSSSRRKVAETARPRRNSAKTKPQRRNSAKTMERSSHRVAKYDERKEGMREKLKSKFQAMDPAKRQEWRKRFEMDKARKLKEKELKRREMERMDNEEVEKRRRHEMEQQRVRHGKRNWNTRRPQTREARNTRRPTRGRKKEVRRARSRSSSSSSEESTEEGGKVFVM
jgi:hypothetical protein